MSVEKRITDTSEKFAIMCRKANKYIEAKININNLVFAKIKGVSDGPTVHIVTSENIDKFEDPIRVFSQRELERLVFEPDKTCVGNFLDFAGWVKSLKNNSYLIIDSMEKLMLCYLMDKVYGRLWNGTDWIEA